MRYNVVIKYHLSRQLQVVYQLLGLRQMLVGRIVGLVKKQTVQK